MEKAIEEYQYLVQKGILTNLGKLSNAKISKILINDIGTNKDGVYYLVVYGHSYCKTTVESEKIRISTAFATVILTLCAK